MRRFLRRVLVAAAVLAAVYFAVAGWMLSGILLNVVTVGGALGGIETQTRSPYELNYDGDPRRAFGLAFEDAMVATKLGDAPAWIVPGMDDTQDELWAVYAHGIAGRRESGYKALSVLHPLGVTVLLPSYRNDAGAPAAPEGVYGFGVTEWSDLEAAVTLAEERGARRFILAGDSMGGAIIGEFLARSPKALAVVAIALDAPALDVRAVTENISERAGFPLPVGVAWTARRILSSRTGIDLSGAVTLPTLARFSGPVFVAHGAADSVVPVAVSDTLLSRRQAPTVYLRTGADHVLSWQEDPERYRTALDAFLRSAVGDSR